MADEKPTIRSLISAVIVLGRSLADLFQTLHRIWSPAEASPPVSEEPPAQFALPVPRSA